MEATHKAAGIFGLLLLSGLAIAEPMPANAEAVRQARQNSVRLQFEMAIKNCTHQPTRAQPMCRKQAAAARTRSLEQPDPLASQ